MGRNTRFARTAAEEDLTQEDAALLFADSQYTADLPATSTTTTTTTATAETSSSSSSPSTTGTDSLPNSGLYSPAIASSITTTTACTAGAASAAAVLTQPAGAARRAPRAPPAAPPELPATAAQVTDLPSLLGVVNSLSMTIVKAVQEGKSVTAPNKRLILLATEETRRAMATFQRLATSTMTALTPSHTHTATPATPATIQTAPTEPMKDVENLRRDLVSCVREEMVKLKGEIVTSVVDAARPTYAQMLNTRIQSPAVSKTTHTNKFSSQHTPSAATRPAIIVSTKLPVKTRQEIVTAWRNSISFRDSTYAPAKIQPISNNKLRVEFETAQHRDDALERLQGSEKVSAEPARKLQPMFIIKGVTKDIPPEDIIKIIKRQNPALGVPEASPDIRLKFTRRNRNEQLYNAVFVANPSIFRKVVELGRINIDHQKSHVEEFSPFMQCFGCLQFGHGQKYCTASYEKPCAYCSETTHREAECPSKLSKSPPKCYNCVKRNSKFNLQQNIQHTATSNSCPVLCVMKARVDQRIDYGCF